MTSLDGYVNDAAGRFDWAVPDAEVHAHVNDGERDVTTYLYGRRMFTVMRAWESPADWIDEGPETADYAEIWRAATKIVYSSTLGSVSGAQTTVAVRFDPAEVAQLKAETPGELSIGGPTLAAAALRAGLVDEIRFYLNPIVVGGGTRALPADLRIELEPIDQRRFGNGVVHLAYRVAS